MLKFKELVHQREALDVAIKEALILESAVAKSEANELGLAYCIKRKSQTMSMQKLPVPKSFFEQKAGEALAAQGLRLGDAPTRLETAVVRLLAALDAMDVGCNEPGFRGSENGHGEQVGDELQDAREALAALVGHTSLVEVEND